MSLSTSVNSIGNIAFSGCSGFEGSLTIPDSVTTIEAGAFSNCIGFTSLSIGAQVETIDSEAFSGCSGFKGDLTIPDSIETIGAGAFSNCNGFTSLSIGSGNKAIIIGNRAFSGCSGLTGKLTIPDTVTSIGNEAFSGCSGFTGLSLGIHLGTIGDSAFSGCSGFGGSLTIPNSVTSIGNHSFEGTAFTGELIIPEGAGNIVIYDAAFKDCRGLTSLKILRNLSHMGKEAFMNCSGLKGIPVLPDNLNYISDGVFSGCTGLSGNLILSSRLNYIGAGAFKNCSGLTGELIIPNGISSIGASAFEGCSGFSMKDLIIPSSVYSVGDRAFAGCTGISGSFAKMGPYYFSYGSAGKDLIDGCSDLNGPILITTENNKEFTIVAWVDRSSKGNLKIPDTIKGMKLTSIKDGAFSGCSGFTGDLIIPEGVTSIGTCAFQNCTGLTGNLIIPDSVTSIGTNAFGSCSGLTGNLALPEELKTLSTAAFNGCSGFDGELIIPGGVETIGTAAFSNCSGLTGDLVIPEGVTRIDGGAFSSCSGLSGNLILPQSMKYIDGGVFSGCSGLSGDIIIPEGVTYVGSGAFYGCSGFDGQLIIPDSVETMYEDTFTGCFGITEIINDSDKTVPASCFLENDTDCFISDDGETIYKDGTIGKGTYVRGTGVDGVTLDKEKVSLTIGESVMLTATVTPSEAGDKSVKWFTGDPGIATVSNGVVTGISAGKTIVTVSTNEAGYTATCEITVTDETLPPEPDPEPDPKPEPLQKTYTVIFMDGDTVFDTQTVKAGSTAAEPSTKPSKKDSIFIGWAYGSSIWNFTTPVNKDLVLTASYKPEKVNVNDNSGSGKDPQPVIKEGKLYLVKGQKYTAGGTGWSSDDESVVQVAADTGKMTAKKAGIATVKNDTDSYTVYVAEPSINEGSKKIEMIVGNTAEVELKINAAGNTESNYPVTWNSSNTKVAVVNNGTVTGIAKGSAVISAYVGGKEYKSKVKVADTYKAPSKFETKEAAFNMNPLQTFALKFDKGIFNVKGAAWSGDGMKKSDGGSGYENAVVKINSAGKITSVGAGTTTITGSDKDGKQVTVTVTVVPVSTKEAYYITKGKKTTVRFPKVVNRKAENWKSSNEGAATVDHLGRVTGAGQGSSEISCTYKGFTFTTKVYVEDPELYFDGVKYESGAQVSMKAGEMKQFKVDKVGQTLNYTSSRSKVAFVDENGFVYARQKGKTNITTKINGKKYVIKLEVE